MDLCEIIEEAKLCSANMAHKWAKAAAFGNADDDFFLTYLNLNSLIRTLERNKKKVVYEKEKIPVGSQEITFSMLKKKNSFLTLELKDQYVCVKKTIDPCLTDYEVMKVIEHVKLICSSCSCNC